MTDRSEVYLLIQELREACRRPLFNEISLELDTFAKKTSPDCTNPSNTATSCGIMKDANNNSLFLQQQQQPSSGNGFERNEQEKLVQPPPAPPPPETASSRDALSETDSQDAFSSLPAIAATFATEKGEDISQNKKRTWTELLNDASKLLPLLTEKEHGEISHLASILLLGFLLPHSTGNEFFLLQHMPDNWSDTTTNLSNTTETAAATTTDKQNSATTKYILNMDLNERLESVCRHYNANEVGEFDTLTDGNWEVCFDSFLKEGLAPFLGGRPAHFDAVGLLHIIAMSIHPEPSAELRIPDTCATLENKPFWLKAQTLMTNRNAHSFQINYEHRLKLIHLIVRDLVIPSYDPGMPIVNSPLFDGALPHLRASLHAFAMNAVSMRDVHWARSANVSIAVQCRIEVVLKEEWEFLINKMVDDRTHYPGCACCPQMLKEGQMGYWFQDVDPNRVGDASFCPHAARGIHLAEFLIRACQSRHSDEGTLFLNEAFSSLTDAIEWQMHCWKQPDDVEHTDSEEPPCMLASLLFAAKSFFYFLPPMEENGTDIITNTNGNDDDDEEDNGSDVNLRREELISCSIQLVHHYDEKISSEAAQLVALAFAYGSKKSIEHYAKALFQSLELLISSICDTESKQPSLECHFLSRSILNVVSSASRMSPAFALSTTNLLLEQLAKQIADNERKASKDKDGDVTMKDDNDNSTNKLIGGHSELQHFLLQLLSSIAISNPVIIAEKTEVLVALLDTVAESSSQCEVISALLACRLSRFFEQKDDTGNAAVLRAVKQNEDRWSLYQMARLSLRTGNFASASQCYYQIVKTALSERYFLWISSLAKISDSELHLSKYAAAGIPSASATLRSALSLLQSLKILDPSQESEFALQITLVKLRLDFLDLLTGLRQLIKEMRLTGAGPGKRTRSFLHFHNITRCFDALARRYRLVYRMYGLFSCQQSRTSLRTLHSLCRFVARAVRVVFSDILPVPKKEENWPGGQPSGDLTLPVSRFMQRLDDRLLQKMSPSIDPVIRAAAMLEVVEGILLCPAPFPTSFFSVAVLPVAQLILSADPENDDYPYDGDTEERREDLGTIEACPGISFDFCARGTIPSSFLTKARLPFTTILLWHRAEYVGAVQENEHLPDEKQDDEHMADEKQDEESLPQKVIPSPWSFGAPVATDLLANRTFNFKVECPPIREEGNYMIEVKLGCRDIRGGEWEASLKKGGKVESFGISFTMKCIT